MYLLNNTFCLNVMAWVSVGAFMCLSSLRVWAGFCFACVLCAIEFGNRSSPHFVKCARRCFLCIMVTMKTIDDIGTRLESVFEFAEQRHTATMTQKDKSSIEMDMAKKNHQKALHVFSDSVANLNECWHWFWRRKVFVCHPIPARVRYSDII